MKSKFSQISQKYVEGEQALTKKLKEYCWLATTAGTHFKTNIFKLRGK